jgi:hypothetical protein
MAQKQQNVKKKYMYGEVFLLYPTNSTFENFIPRPYGPTGTFGEHQRRRAFSEREKGTTCLNFVYNQISKSLLSKQNKKSD